MKVRLPLLSHSLSLSHFSRFRPFQISVFVRDWALSRWPERTLVNLQAELPHLRELAFLDREAAAEEQALLEAVEEEYVEA